MEIYVKMKKRVFLADVKEITIGDIADIHDSTGHKKRICAIRLLRPQVDGAYLVSITDVVRAIDVAQPGHSISSIGESDCVVEYRVKMPKTRAWLMWLRVVLVAITLFVGASTAIMTFHTDSQMNKVFSRYHELLFAETTEKPYIISIPYSVGLALGIILFFNHFSGKRLTREPSPIEVEMATYQKEVEDSMIENLEKQKDGDL